MALSFILPLERNNLVKGGKTQAVANLFNYSIPFPPTTSDEDNDNLCQNDSYSDGSGEFVSFASPYDKKRRIWFSKAKLAMWPCFIILCVVASQCNAILIPTIIKMALDNQNTILPQKIIKQLTLTLIKLTKQRSSANKSSYYNSDQVYLNNQRGKLSNNRNSFFSTPHDLSSKDENNQPEYMITPSAPPLLEDEEIAIEEQPEPSAPEWSSKEEEGELTAEGEGSIQFLPPPKYNPEAVPYNINGEQEDYYQDMIEPGQPDYIKDQPEGKPQLEQLNHGQANQFGEPDEYSEYSNNKNSLFPVPDDNEISLEGVIDHRANLTNTPK